MDGDRAAMRWADSRDELRLPVLRHAERDASTRSPGAVRELAAAAVVVVKWPLPVRAPSGSQREVHGLVTHALVSRPEDRAAHFSEGSKGDLIP